MKKVELGSTGIMVSKLGMGTGTAHPSGRCAQALMDKKELAGLLVYAFERGVNFWDTAFQYGTYPHIKQALRHVKRTDVVIATKLTTSGRKDTIRDFNASLKDLSVDYVDVSLLHGVRTERELKNRQGALDTMLEFKRQGKIRAVGLSSHGLSALNAAIKIPEIDAVWVRINYAGLCMDSWELALYDQLASISWLKKAVKKIIPKRLILAVRPKPETDLKSVNERNEVGDMVKTIHSQSRGVVGMKVFAEGQLGNNAQKAVKYLSSLPYVDSFVIGMLNRDEIDENCTFVDG